MTATCTKHEEHSHVHGPNCGHTAVKHDGHTDYLHDGHLHHVHESHVDEHKVSTNAANQDKCTPEHSCGAHEQITFTVQTVVMSACRTEIMWIIS